MYCNVMYFLHENSGVKSSKGSLSYTFFKVHKDSPTSDFFYELSTSNLKAYSILLCTRYTLGKTTLFHTFALWLIILYTFVVNLWKSLFFFFLKSWIQCTLSSFVRRRLILEDCLKRPLQKSLLPIFLNISIPPLACHPEQLPQLTHHCS